jgi:hypothetical protein
VLLGEGNDLGAGDGEVTARLGWRIRLGDGAARVARAAEHRRHRRHRPTPATMLARLTLRCRTLARPTLGGCVDDGATRSISSVESQRASTRSRRRQVARMLAAPRDGAVSAKTPRHGEVRGPSRRAKASPTATGTTGTTSKAANATTTATSPRERPTLGFGTKTSAFASSRGRANGTRMFFSREVQGSPRGTATRVRPIAAARGSHGRARVAPLGRPALGSSSADSDCSTRVRPVAAARGSRGRARVCFTWTTPRWARVRSVDAARRVRPIAAARRAFGR